MSMDKFMKDINKKLGENTISYCAEGGPIIDFTSSGSLTMDLALGGGLPSGRIIEYFGDTMAGKTTLSYLHMAEVQKQGQGLVVFVDAEHAMSKELAEEYGVDLESLIYVSPKTAENAVDIMDALIRSGDVRLIVVDSVSAMVPTKIVESSAEQQTMALLARFMSTTMQKLVGIAYEHNTTIIFINQVREAIGKFAPHGITPTVTSGGRSLPFYSSQRILVRMGERIKDANDEVIGHNIRVRVVKNKVAVPFKEANFPLIYGHGVDLVDEVAQVAILAGFIIRAGAWYRIVDTETGEVLKNDDAEMKFQGMPALVNFLRDNPDQVSILESKIRGTEIELPDGEVIDDESYDLK